MDTDIRGMRGSKLSDVVTLVRRVRPNGDVRDLGIKVRVWSIIKHMALDAETGKHLTSFRTGVRQHTQWYRDRLNKRFEKGRDGVIVRVTWAEQDTLQPVAHVEFTLRSGRKVVRACWARDLDVV